MAENEELENPNDKRILIVDDDEGQMDLISMLVEREGFKVDKAVDGASALKKALAETPDLILLDLMLPGMGGYELVGALQAEGLTAVPVIIISARTLDRKTIDRFGMEPNVKGFMQKPPKPVALAGLMHSQLKTQPIVRV